MLLEVSPLSSEELWPAAAAAEEFVSASLAPVPRPVPDQPTALNSLATSLALETPDLSVLGCPWLMKNACLIPEAWPLIISGHANGPKALSSHNVQD